RLSKGRYYGRFRDSAPPARRQQPDREGGRPSRRTPSLTVGLLLSPYPLWHTCVKHTKESDGGSELRSPARLFLSALLFFAIVSRPRGVPPAALRKIGDYTKLFWANSGNHNGYTAQKFLPDFTYAELEQAALQAIKNGGLQMTPDELRKELNDLRQSFFDPA